MDGLERVGKKFVPHAILGLLGIGLEEVEDHVPFLFSVRRREFLEHGKSGKFGFLLWWLGSSWVPEGCHGRDLHVGLHPPG